MSLVPPPAVPMAVNRIENRDVPGSQGAIPVRIYYAETSTDTRGALVYFHGGGWVIGNLDRHDETCRRLGVGSGSMIISVGYRLAPETRYPGPMIDCYDVTAWTARETKSLGIDPERIAVGGDSAGGNLAAGVEVSVTRHDGVVHGFFGMHSTIAKAGLATAQAVKALKQHLGG